MSALITTAPAGEPIVVMRRVFAAPRALVWQAHTEARHIERWWGPRDYTTRVLELDLRPGGTWRFENVTPEGTVHPFRGTYREVVPPGRLVNTFQYRDYPAVLVTIELEEDGGKTTLTGTSLFPSIAARDGMVASGMERGSRESYERLDELLPTF